MEVRRVDLANGALRTSPKFITGVKYQFHQGFDQNRGLKIAITLCPQVGPTWRWGEWIWLTGPCGLYRNSSQGLNISFIRVFDQIRDAEIPITLRPQQGIGRSIWRKKIDWKTMKQMGRYMVERDLLRVRNWRETARNREERRGRIGEAMAGKRAEEP